MSNKENKYQLNDQEREQWYNETLKPLFLEGKHKSDKPTFVLLTGQSGAGKTTASVKYAQLIRPEPVKLGGDDIRILLPYARDVLKENPEEYPFITKKDMSWARQKLITEAFEAGYNIQLDSILSSPDDWRMGTLLQAKEHGYRVECVALGVHRYLSEVSMFSRREEQIKTSGVGFPVTMKHHDLAYDLLPMVVSKMYTEGIADKVSVYNRVFENYYDTSKAENPSGQDIMRALIKARNDYLSKDSIEYIQAIWENVYTDMVVRNANETQMNEIRSYYTAFHKSSGLHMVDKPQGVGILIIQYQQKTGIGGK